MRYLTLIGIVACGGQGSQGTPDASSDTPPPAPVADAGELTESAPYVPTACEQAAISHDGVGCEYFVYLPLRQYNYEWGCLTAVLVNPGNPPAVLSVFFDGKSFDPTIIGHVPRIVSPGKVEWLPLSGGLLPGHGVAVLGLVQGGHTPHGPFGGCTASAVTTLAPINSSGARSHAFRIRSSSPVTAYTIKYDGTYPVSPEASLMWASSSWDASGVDVGLSVPPKPWQVLGLDDSSFEPGPIRLGVIARQSNTKVTIDGFGGSETHILGLGEQVDLARDDRFIGAAVASTHPVSLWVAADNAAIPYDGPRNSAHVKFEVPPQRVWGDEYAAVPHRPRFDGEPDPVVWRIVTGLEGVDLVYDAGQPAGAPSSLGARSVAMFGTAQAFVVRSHGGRRFYLSGAMTGAAAFPDVRGGPTSLPVLSRRDWDTSYDFYVEPSFSETDVVVVRRRGEQGWEDVKLDCAGTLGKWTSLGTAFEFVHLALSRGDFQPQMIGNGVCATGFHHMESVESFGVTVWGWGTKAVTVYPSSVWSYGYPVAGRHLGNTTAPN